MAGGSTPDLKLQLEYEQLDLEAEEAALRGLDAQTDQLKKQLHVKEEELSSMYSMPEEERFQQSRADRRASLQVIRNQNK